MTDRKIIEDREEIEEFGKEVDDFIDDLIEEGYDPDDIEAVLTDEDFLAKLDDLDTEIETDEEDEGAELLGEISKKKLGQYVKKATVDYDKGLEFASFRQGKVYGKELAKKRMFDADRADAKKDSNISHKRREGIMKAVDRLSKEETETMMKSISKGKMEWGTVTPILANAAVFAIRSMPEDDRAEVIESVYTDSDEFHALITSRN